MYVQLDVSNFLVDLSSNLRALQEMVQYVNNK
jgi:hypothetical protein